MMRFSTVPTTALRGLACALLSSTVGGLCAMEAEGKESFSVLRALTDGDQRDLMGRILLEVAGSASQTIEERIETLRAFSVVNKQWNAMLNEPKMSDMIIDVLAQAYLEEETETRGALRELEESTRDLKVMAAVNLGTGAARRWLQEHYAAGAQFKELVVRLVAGENFDLVFTAGKLQDVSKQHRYWFNQLYRAGKLIPSKDLPLDMKEYPDFFIGARSYGFQEGEQLALDTVLCKLSRQRELSPLTNLGRMSCKRLAALHYDPSRLSSGHTRACNFLTSGKVELLSLLLKNRRAGKSNCPRCGDLLGIVLKEELYDGAAMLLECPQIGIGETGAQTRGKLLLKVLTAMREPLVWQLLRGPLLDVSVTTDYGWTACEIAQELGYPQEVVEEIQAWEKKNGNK